MPAVSVLIRTIGRQEALKEALASLGSQTFRDFEVVVVEDGPATLTAFLAYYAGLVIRYEALGERKGRSTAGNRALALAEGEYCLFLDEDDAFYPAHLQSLATAARTGNQAVAYSWSEERKVDRAADGSIIRRGKWKRIRRERFSLLHLMAANFLPINAVLFKRELFKRAGGFDEDVDCLEDWLLWLRYAALEPEWLCVPEVTAIYHTSINIAARRKAFHAWHQKARDRMRGITAAWPVETVQRDLKRHFRIGILLRKLYYHFTGYIGWL